jgi:glucokinase
MDAVRGGVDLGGTKIQAVVVDHANTVVGQARRPTPKAGGPDGVAEEIAATLGEAAAVAGLEPTHHPAKRGGGVS